MAKPIEQHYMLGEGADMDKYLSRIDVWAIAFGCIIGWGAFVMPGTTFLPIAGPAGTVIAMLIGAAIMIVISRNYAYLMARRPGIGGVYAYTQEAFGKDHAFLCSWFLSLSYISIVFLNATALFVVSRTLFGNMLHVGFHYNIAGFEVYLTEIAMSTAAILIIGILLLLKKPMMQYVMTSLAVILFIGSVIITIICVPNISSIDNLFYFNPEGNLITVLLTIIMLSPWAYVGFDIVSLETAHFKFPVKKSGKVIVLSILAGAFVYIAMSMVSISALPDGCSSWIDYVAQLDNLSGVDAVPTFFAAKTYLGTTGLIIIGITALAAILTGLIAAFRATARVLSTMAEDTILSKRFTSTRFCIMFITIISIIVSFLGRNALVWFVDLTTFGAIVGFGYTSAAAYKTAKAENNKKVQITGLIGSLISALFFFIQVVPSITQFETMGPESFIMLSLWCLLGFAFYWRSMRRSVLSEFNGAATSSTILFALLLYSAMMWFLMRVMSNVESAQERSQILKYSIMFFTIAAIGLTVMLYIRKLLRRRHETLEREKIRAEESNIAKSRFLFNMSHDIRTPMNAIIGYTNLAKKEQSVQTINEYLDNIDSASQHLLELINDILEMSRFENGVAELHPVPVDIVRFFDSINNLFRGQMKEKDLTFNIDASNVKDRYVICDVKSLNRIVINIIGNAYKFTPEGGQIDVVLTESDEHDDSTGIYTLSVKDNGVGMSAEFAEKVFNAFERERTSTVSGIQGTGLGMAITKNLIDLMCGTIKVITEEGKGTEFIIILPLELTDADNPELTDLPGSEIENERIDFTKIRLLLVEDNEINMQIASLILSENGFTVDTADNGAMAVDKVRSSRPGYYDAILMDIQMPIMDGYEATAAIRALSNKSLADIPIIAMTANAFKEDEAAALDAGMQGHIAKPIDVNIMLNTLTRVLNEFRRNKYSR